MNKIQKSALFGLVGALFFIILCVCLGVNMFVMQKMPSKSFVWAVAAFCIFGGVGLLWVLRKRRPAQVDSDERDRFIEKRAVLVSFISVWVLLAAETIIPRFIVGLDGSIPVWMLAIMNVAILFGTMVVYFAAVLIQYGRTPKGEKS